VGLGLRNKLSRLRGEASILLSNSLGRPSLYRGTTRERVGVIFTEPSDMCVADRILLYALVRGLRPERVLEIGVRWGGGARIISSALEDVGAGKAVGIDPSPEQFRAKASELFGRYELVSGFSPEITEDAVKKLGGAVDLALIDAMHTHSHSLADLRGILPFMAEGGHILLHDTFHQGIDHTVSIVLSENAHVVDCGFISRHPEITEAPVAYQGLRLLRVGTQSSDDIIRNAYLREGKPEPAFSSDLWDWDHHWNRLKTAS